MRSKPYSTEDIRFTRSKNGATLYAVGLAFPADGKVTVKALSENSIFWDGKIGSVQMLGVRDELNFTRDNKGLHVMLPEKKPCAIAFALKITK